MYLELLTTLIPSKSYTLIVLFIFEGTHSTCLGLQAKSLRLPCVRQYQLSNILYCALSWILIIVSIVANQQRWIIIPLLRRAWYFDTNYFYNWWFEINNNFMSNNSYPQPPSHRTFTLGKVIIDSNFDSGNCCLAEKVNATTVLLSLLSMLYGLRLITPRTSTGCGFIFLLRASPKAHWSASKSKICKTK